MLYHALSAETSQNLRLINTQSCMPEFGGLEHLPQIFGRRLDGTRASSYVFY